MLFQVVYRAVFTVLRVEPLTCLQLIIWNKRENNKCIAITTPRPLTFIGTRIRCHMYNAVLTRLADQFTIVGGQIILILSQNKTRTLMVNKIHTLATCKKNQCTFFPSGASTTTVNDLLESGDRRVECLEKLGQVLR